MHSIIVQISTKPIPKDNYLTVSDIYNSEDGFVPRIADYVREFDDCDNVNGLQWFLDYGKNDNLWSVGKDNDKNIYFQISKNQKQAFLARELENIFKNCREVLSNRDSIETMFMKNGNCYDLMGLKNSLKDEFQIRIVDEWSMNMDLTSWLRSPDSETETRYYIGNILDYHF